MMDDHQREVVGALKLTVVTADSRPLPALPLRAAVTAVVAVAVTAGSYVAGFLFRRSLGLPLAILLLAVALGAAVWLWRAGPRVASSRFVAVGLVAGLGLAFYPRTTPLTRAWFSSRALAAGWRPSGGSTTVACCAALVAVGCWS